MAKNVTSFGGERKARGRPKGVPNKTTTAVREAIIEAFQKSGGAKYLAKIAIEDPRTFCALLGRVLPLEVTGEGGAPIRLIVVTGVPAPDKPNA